jgi:hypothetical protein
MMRHHTVLNRPIIAFEQEGQIINADAVAKDSDLFLVRSREMLVGRYLHNKEATEYRPVGYDISAAKAHEERASGKLSKTLSRRVANHNATARIRLASKQNG